MKDDLAGGALEFLAGERNAGGNGGAGDRSPAAVWCKRPATSDDRAPGDDLRQLPGSYSGGQGDKGGDIPGQGRP
eukprot:7881841-Pyramimonas_sp.AAC.1